MPDRPTPNQPINPHRIGRRGVVRGMAAVPTVLATTNSDAGTSEEAGEAVLLALCDLVRRLEADEHDDVAERWNDAVMRIGATPARTVLGLRAKAQLLIELSPRPAGDIGAACNSPEEALLASLLEDVLVIVCGTKGER